MTEISTDIYKEVLADLVTTDSSKYGEVLLLLAAKNPHMIAEVLKQLKDPSFHEKIREIEYNEGKIAAVKYIRSTKSWNLQKARDYFLTLTNHD